MHHADLIADIGLGGTLELLVFNKADRVDEDTRRGLATDYPGALFISATSGDGISQLLNRIIDIHAHSGMVYDPD